MAVQSHNAPVQASAQLDPQRIVNIALATVLEACGPKKRVVARCRLETFAERLRNEALGRHNVYSIRSRQPGMPLHPEADSMLAAADAIEVALKRLRL